MCRSLSIAEAVETPVVRMLQEPNGVVCRSLADYAYRWQSEQNAVVNTVDYHDMLAAAHSEVGRNTGAGLAGYNHYNWEQCPLELDRLRASCRTVLVDERERKSRALKTRRP